MHRFFISPGQIREGRIHIEGTEFRHAVKSLRLRKGEVITIIDGEAEYSARIERVSAGSAEALILGRSGGTRDSSCQVTLCQALIKIPRFEIILEKATELGVACIVPLVTERSVRAAPGSERYERWERILRSAACQCGRVTVPTLLHPVPFSRALESVHASLGLILSPSASLQHISRIVPDGIDSAALFLGPEGGFSDGELRQASGCGLHPISLGRRILRAETAAIASLSVLFHELECGGEPRAAEAPVNPCIPM